MTLQDQLLGFCQNIQNELDAVKKITENPVVSLAMQNVDADAENLRFTYTDGTVTTQNIMQMVLQWLLDKAPEDFNKTVFDDSRLAALINSAAVGNARPNPYLSFIEVNNEVFTFKTENLSKNWNGILEYSTDTKNWSEWNGEEINSSDNGRLYLRGTGNNKISNSPAYYDFKYFSLTENKNIRCIGNIENLLDYKTVKSGNHPEMSEYCFSYLFFNCTSLIQAPELPATTLADYCYSSMFYGCESLTQAPELPATTLANHCYSGIFHGCKSLTQAPELPATELADYCYSSMFYGCKSLTQAPELSVATLARGCYSSMFSCCSLIQAPELPATTLADYCYDGMFYGCKSLTQAPELPATELTASCYRDMFQGCTSLTKATELYATALAEQCYRGMFKNCSSLVQAPESLPAAELHNFCYQSMFNDCISLTGQIHCPASTKNKSNKLLLMNSGTAEVVFDL